MIKCTEEEINNESLHSKIINGELYYKIFCPEIEKGLQSVVESKIIARCYEYNLYWEEEKYIKRKLHLIK